jgi:hypothetical protein
MNRPSFAPTAAGQEYCVIVTWADGAITRINHFASPQDAQRWTDRESERWLANRARTRDERRAELNSAPKFGGPRVRWLQAA